MSRFQILSLDGGGIRGAFQLGFLAEFEESTGRRCHECFDLIAGTSTGAITASALCYGKTAAEMIEFYLEHGRDIFKPREPYRAKGWVRPLYPIVNWVFRSRQGYDMDPLFRAKYCPHALRLALEAGSEGARLSDLTHARFITPTVNLTRGRAQVFRTPHFAEPPVDLAGPAPVQDPLVVDVLMASTAAPTYFPHATIAGEAYADGGLWAINPSVLAIAEAMKIRQQCVGDHCPAHYDTSGMWMLSVGTGNISYSLTPPGSDAGALFWVSHSADVMSVSQVQGVQSPLRFLLGGRFHSVNFEIPNPEWSLDGTDHLEDQIRLGRIEARGRMEQLAEMFAGHTGSDYRAEVADLLATSGAAPGGPKAAPGHAEAPNRP